MWRRRTLATARAQVEYMRHVEGIRRVERVRERAPSLSVSRRDVCAREIIEGTETDEEENKDVERTRLCGREASALCKRRV